LLALEVLSGGVADGCDQEFQVPVVQAGKGVAQGDGEAFGDAGGELEDALFPAFSELKNDRQYPLLWPFPGCVLAG